MESFCQIHNFQRQPANISEKSKISGRRYFLITIQKQVLSLRPTYCSIIELYEAE